MPVKKRAARANIRNLSKAKRKNNIYGKFISHPSSQTSETLLPFAVAVHEPDLPFAAAVLDEPDTLDRDDAMLNDNGDDSEGSSIEILDGGSDTDIYEESELAKFSRMLSDAQKRAREKEKAQGKKRKTYNGHSRTTAYRQKRVQKNHAAKGFLPLRDFMKLMESKKNADKQVVHCGKFVTNLPLHKDLMVESEEEESSEDDAAFVSQPRSNQSCISEDTDIEELARAASEGPALIEECYRVAQSPTPIEERCWVTQGPTTSDDRRRVMQGLPEEEEESTESEDKGEDGQNEHRGATPFEELRRRVLMESTKPSGISTDGIPVFLCDRPNLRTACAKLTVEVGNKGLDLVTRRRIQAMLGLLNLYLDDGLLLSWRKTSVVVSKAQGHGDAHARRIRKWTVEFLQHGALPLHRLGQARWTVLSDEDIASEIKLQMVEKSKKGFLKAEDLVDLVATPEMQEIFSEKGICKKSISKKTATRWLQKLDWRYKGIKKGMYIDGHEREDVVAYRREFIERFKFYEKRFHQWDNDGQELPRPNGFPVPDGPPFRLVLITHDESTFYQNDRRKIAWAQTTSRPTPQPKGEGQSIMVSDFLTSEWGRLRDGDECVHPSCCLSLILFLLTSLQGGSNHLQSWQESRWVFRR
jgi:hypothetical protein